MEKLNRQVFRDFVEIFPYFLVCEKYVYLSEHFKIFVDDLIDRLIDIYIFYYYWIAKLMCVRREAILIRRWIFKCQNQLNYRLEEHFIFNKNKHVFNLSMPLKVLYEGVFQWEIKSFRKTILFHNYFLEKGHFQKNLIRKLFFKSEIFIGIDYIIWNLTERSLRLRLPFLILLNGLNDVS